MLVATFTRMILKSEETWWKGGRKVLYQLCSVREDRADNKSSTLQRHKAPELLTNPYLLASTDQLPFPNEKDGTITAGHHR